MNRNLNLKLHQFEITSKIMSSLSYFITMIILFLHFIITMLVIITLIRVKITVGFSCAPFSLHHIIMLIIIIFTILLMIIIIIIMLIITTPIVGLVTCALYLLDGIQMHSVAALKEAKNFQCSLIKGEQI